MEDDTLVLLRDVIVRLVRECGDADLLDLLCELLLNQPEPQMSHDSIV